MPAFYSFYPISFTLPASPPHLRFTVWPSLYIANIGCVAPCHILPLLCVAGYFTFPPLKKSRLLSNRLMATANVSAASNSERENNTLLIRPLGWSSSIREDYTASPTYRPPVAAGQLLALWPRWNVTSSSGSDESSYRRWWRTRWAMATQTCTLCAWSTALLNRREKRPRSECARSSWFAVSDRRLSTSSWRKRIGRSVPTSGSPLPGPDDYSKFDILLLPYAWVNNPHHLATRPQTNIWPGG